MSEIARDTCPIGTRALVRERWGRMLREVKVLEWAPSGKAAKLQGDGGNSYWTDDLPHLVEILPAPHTYLSSYCPTK